MTSGQDIGLTVPSVGVVVRDRERGLVLRIDAGVAAAGAAAAAAIASSPMLLLVDEVLTPERRLNG